MKRRNLIKHLENNGASFLREGRRHTIYAKEKMRTQIPRHTEIVDELARKICRDLARKICRDLDIPYIK